MQVLVAFGSKMGGTAEIASEIAERLEARGLAVTVSDAGTVPTAEGFDAVVVGSSLYAGRWRGETVRLLKHMVGDGYDGPVWLFHSGPLTDEEAHTPQDLPRKVADYADRLDTRATVTFGGVLDEHPSGFIARKLASSMAGDWRDWDEIDQWADEIASELQGVRPES